MSKGRYASSRRSWPKTEGVARRLSVVAGQRGEHLPLQRFVRLRHVTEIGSRDRRRRGPDGSSIGSVAGASSTLRSVDSIEIAVVELVIASQKPTGIRRTFRVGGCASRPVLDAHPAVPESPDGEVSFGRGGAGDIGVLDPDPADVLVECVLGDEQTAGGQRLRRRAEPGTEGFRLLGGQFRPLWVGKYGARSVTARCRAGRPRRLARPPIRCSLPSAPDNRHPPIGVVAISRPLQQRELGTRQLRADRILNEARHSADPVSLIRIFGITVTTAMCSPRATHPEPLLGTAPLSPLPMHGSSSWTEFSRWITYERVRHDAARSVRRGGRVSAPASSGHQHHFVRFR